MKTNSESSDEKFSTYHESGNEMTSVPIILGTEVLNMNRFLHFIEYGEKQKEERIEKKESFFLQIFTFLYFFRMKTRLISKNIESYTHEVSQYNTSLVFLGN